MDYNKLSKITDSLINDDVKSESRLNDLLNGPHADDFRYYRNQLNKCSEDKRKERVTTWYNILKEQKPQIAEQLKEEFSKYLETIETKSEPVSTSEKPKQPEVSERDLQKERGLCYQAICLLLRDKNRLKEVARRSSEWKTFSGRIGQYSHKWVNPQTGKPIKDIESKLNQREKSLITYASWRGEYYEGIWIEGGFKFRPFECNDVYGSYDDGTDITVYEPMRVPQSLQKEIVNGLFEHRESEKFPHLTREDIQETYNKIFS